MRIEEIKIKNFRQYRDITFNFNTCKENDLHVILGKNGTGKTNLLNAITWCIYNEEFHLGNSENALKRVNVNALKEAKENGIEEIDVEVSVTISDDTGFKTYSRIEPFKVNSDFIKMQTFNVITKDRVGNIIKYENKEDIDHIINANLPESIREYFFFDGEQLDNYFLNSNGTLIKDAIYNISQVKLLTDSRERLEKVINELESSAGSKNIELNDLIKKKEDLIKNNEKLSEYIQKLDEQITISKNEIKECSEYLKSSEGVPEKEKELESIRQEIDKKDNEIKEVNDKIKNFIKKYTILFGYYNVNKKTLEIIQEKEKDGLLPPNIDKNLLKSMLLEHKCLICESDLDKDKEEHIKDILEKLQVSSELSNLLSKIKGSLETNIFKIREYNKEKNEILDYKKTLETKQKTLKNKADEIYKFLKNFTDREEIKQKHIKRNKHNELLDENLMKKGSYSESLKANTIELQKIQKDIDATIEKTKQLDFIKKKIDFAKRSAEIISSIELEMIDEVKEKMRAKTMEYFNRLIWKENTYSKIELDDNYKLELYHIDGYPSVGSCSAAERALLALSFTLALQEVSGYNSMLFIDTPVGRVDSENREKFAKTLTEISNEKQIIMTFTTSEYSKEIEEVFEPVESSKYILETKDEKETYLG